MSSGSGFSDAPLTGYRALQGDKVPMPVQRIAGDSCLYLLQRREMSLTKRNKLAGLLFSKLSISQLLPLLMPRADLVSSGSGTSIWLMRP